MKSVTKQPTSTETYSSASHTHADVLPAAGIWSGPDPTDPQEQVDFLKREGFLILRGMVSRDDLKELDAEINRIARDHKKLPKIREGFDIEPMKDGSKELPTFRKIGGIAELSDAFAKLMCHPKITGMLRSVMGPEIELYRDVVMMKPARVGREKPWHQDSVYWPWDPMDLISAMTALDNMTPENGCLQVIAQTHHKAVQHFGQELQIQIDQQLQAQTLYVPLQPGDTLLFHSLVLHGSEPNHSDCDRRVIINSYKTPDLKYIGEGEPRKTIKIHNIKPQGYV